MHTQHQHIAASRYAALALVGRSVAPVYRTLPALPELGSEDHPTHMSADCAFETLGLGARASRLSY